MVLVANIPYTYRKWVKGRSGLLLKGTGLSPAARYFLLPEEWNLIYMFLYGYIFDLFWILIFNRKQLASVKIYAPL